MVGVITEHRCCIFETDGSYMQVLFYLSDWTGDKRSFMFHDACGVGFIARTRGEAGHEIVAHGLTALRRLAHRGAPASLGAVDGCGLLTSIPWALLADQFGGQPPAGRTRAIGMRFVHPAHR